MRSGRQRERPDARKEQEASLFLDSTGASFLQGYGPGTPQCASFRPGGTPFVRQGL
jgi:hypothetical protein